MKPELNRTNPAANDGLISEVIREWAAADPIRVALLSEDGDTISYGRLISQIDAIRDALNRLGFGRGDRVAIIHPSDARHVVLSLGVCSGMTTIPLNPASTEEEILRELQNRHADAVLNVAGTSGAACVAAKHLALPVIEMAWKGPSMAAAFSISGGRGGPAACSGLADDDDVALVLASSGTTSQSRVVPIRHRAFSARYKRGARKYIEADRGLTMVPVYLSTGIMNAAGSLQNGGSTIIASTTDTKTFFRVFEALRPTWLQASPALLKGILSDIRDNGRDIQFGQLRFIRPASGRISRSDSDALERIFGCAVIEAYGTTETGKIACNPFPPDLRKPGTVGLPIDCEIAIAGDEGQFLPAGEQGEILVRRDNIFDGYENDAAATSAAFINGWYRTGDLGFLDVDGYLTLVGRIKEMINRGGEKISPAEVESALQSHPLISDAAAFAIPHPTLGEIVGAAVVSEDGALLNRKELIAFLRPKLSTIKVPTAFVHIEKIPRGQYGKVLRNQLVNLIKV